MIGVAGAVTVPVISAGFTGVPFSVSLAYAFTTSCAPLVPFTPPTLSSTASIAFGASLIVTVSVAGVSVPPAGVPFTVAILVTLPGLPARSAAWIV